MIFKRASWKKSIFKNSKSFAAASLFLNYRVRDSTWKLYAWCRISDDEIDNFPENSFHSLLLMKRNLAELSAGKQDFAHPHWQALKEVVDNYHIPIIYLQNMLAGFEIDATSAKIANENDLGFYCHAVAGTVGVMMCHIMGVSSASSLPRAAELGHAMQMTNIARDVFEDFSKGKIYIPENWLLEFGIKRNEIFFEFNRKNLKILIERILEIAERKYTNGLLGTSTLRPASALSVLFAAYCYRHIGRKIINRKNFNYCERVYVTAAEKTVLFSVALFRWSFMLPKLCFNRIIPTDQLPLQEYDYAKSV